MARDDSSNLPVPPGASYVLYAQRCTSAVQVAHKGTLMGTAQVYTSGMEYAHYYSESGLGTH